MKKPNRFLAPVAVAAALALPILTNGCSADPTSSLCCTDFKVGADLSGVDFGVDADIKGQFSAFAQAAGDLSATATAAIDDVAAACKSIAQAGVSDTTKLAAQDNEAATKNSPKDRVNYWCNLAVTRINGTVKAAGTLSITVQPPACQASVKAAASCQANCTVDASCQAKVKATPPKCTGGKLEVACKGECNVTASSPTISCEGSCSGQCTGSCTVAGGVRCNGKCEGTCEATGSANGQAFDASGNCVGTCKGTCSATPPSVACEGSCKGQCQGSCKASPGQVSAKCDGECKGEFEPISCKGGKLEAAVDCNVDAKCQANCDASVQAKAECTPPRVDVVFSGTASAEVNFVIDALKLNLPSIFLVAQARGQAFVKLVADVSANASAVVDPGKLGVKGTACLGAIVPIVVQASDNMSAAVTASLSVTGAIGK